MLLSATKKYLVQGCLLCTGEYVEQLDGDGWLDVEKTE